MLKNAFQRLVGSKNDIETYSLLRLQAKTYRLVKNYVAPVLSKHNLSTLVWSLLGLLKKYPSGCRFVEISTQMGVEPPFVTELVTSIKKDKLIKIEQDPEDRRAKIIVLTSKGEELVNSLEKEIQQKLDKLFEDMSDSEFDTYIRTMSFLSDRLDQYEKENKK